MTLMSILMHLYVDHLVYFLLVEVHREILQVEGDAHVTVTSGEGREEEEEEEAGLNL